MIKIKSIVFCALLFGALTCALLFLAETTVVPSANEIETMNQRTQGGSQSAFGRRREPNTAVAVVIA